MPVLVSAYSESGSCEDGALVGESAASGTSAVTLTAQGFAMLIG